MSKPEEEVPNPYQPTKVVGSPERKPAVAGLSSTGRPDSYRWVIFVLSVVTSWLLYMHRYTFGLIRPQLQEDFGFSHEQLGYIESAFYWPYALGQVPSGAICDMFGAHWFVGSSILIWSLMLLVMAVTRNPILFGIARAFFGAAQSGTYPSLAKVTRIWFPPESRTFIQGCVASFGGRSGAALCPIIFYMLLIVVLGLTWQMALILFALGGIAFGIVFLIFFRSSPSAGSDAIPAASGSIPLGKLVKHWTLWIFAAQQFFNAGADIIFVGHLASYFKAELKINMSESPRELAMFICLPFLGGAIGGLVSGYLNDWLIGRTGNRRWSRSGVAFTGNLLACILVYVATRQVDPWSVALSLTATKFFTDWTQPTCWGACTDIGGRFSATVVGIINMAGNLGAAVMPIVFGLVLKNYTTKSIVDGVTVDVTNYKPVLFIGGVLFLLSACSWFLIDCTQKIDAADEA